MEIKTIINGFIPWYILSGKINKYNKYKIDMINEEVDGGIKSINLGSVSKIGFKEDRKAEIFNWNE